MTRLGETIKKARLGAKMTEKALAKKCGVAESFIKEVEAGRRIVSDDQAQRILNNCFLLLLVLSAVLTLLFLLTKDYLLMWFGASEATFGYADTYLTIYTCGTFFALLSTGMNSFLICQGFSGLGMATVVLGAALNIVLDPLKV